MTNEELEYQLDKLKVEISSMRIDMIDMKYKIKFLQLESLDSKNVSEEEYDKQAEKIVNGN